MAEATLPVWHLPLEALANLATVANWVWAYAGKGYLEKGVLDWRYNNSAHQLKKGL